MKSTIPALLACIVISLLPAGVHADSVDELMEAMNIEEQMLGGFDAMLPMVDQMAAQLSLNDEEKKELVGIYRTWFEEDIDRSKLIKQIAELYRQSFADDEIAELLAFFKSPTGQKMMAISPTLMKEGAKFGMMEAQAKQIILQQRLKPFLEKVKNPGAGE